MRLRFRRVNPIWVWLFAVVGLTSALLIPDRIREVRKKRFLESSDTFCRPIGWDLLRQLDYETGKMPDSLKLLDGAMVRISGFMVPLEDNETGATEFLLIPTSAACIHVAAAPPNMVIRVRMAHGENGPVYQSDPIWIKGVLRISMLAGRLRRPAYAMQAVVFGAIREDEPDNPH